jgi:predicted phosphodiesterase
MLTNDTFFKRLAKRLLLKPVTWLANTFTSRPKKINIEESLTKLYQACIGELNKKSGSLFTFNPKNESIIIFSDQHKGAKNGADDFAPAEKNYCAALSYYNSKKFFYVNLGDCEELWENALAAVIKNNKAAFEKEKLFVDRNAFCKVVGNHDLFWKNDPFASIQIKKIYKKNIAIHDGIVLKIEDKNFDIFCTHGHQGDAQSDGNWFSKWFVSTIWGPLQSFLKINTNSASTNDENKSRHNQIMYEWSVQQKNLLLITGHTHQPVFNSFTHLETLFYNLENAIGSNDEAAISKIENELPLSKRKYNFLNQSFKNIKPSYFNTGCCCFNDGDITGIEIENGYIRLVKWHEENNISIKQVLEETTLDKVITALT